MKTIYFPISLVIVLWLTACSNDGDYDLMIHDSVNFEAAPRIQPQLAVSHERKIIKSGHLDFLTTDLESTRAEVYKSIQKYEGYVSNESSSNHRNRSIVNLTIRVPSENFESLIEDLQAGKEKLIDRSISIDDVTARYIDQETRIRVKKELEEKYIALLEKAENVETILQIEKELSKVREDIEAFETLFKNLQNSINYATLKVTFYTRSDETKTFAEMTTSSFQAGIENFKTLILGIVTIWPFVLLLLLLVLAWRFQRARR